MSISIQMTSECAAPLERVFDYVTDYRNTPSWFYGISRFEPYTEITRGVGASFDAGLTLGVPITTKIATVAFEEGRSFSFDSVSGFKNSSTFTFEAIDERRTRIIADFTYELPGGIAGKAMGKVMSPAVKFAVKSSSENLARLAAEAAH